MNLYRRKSTLWKNIYYIRRAFNDLKNIQTCEFIGLSFSAHLFDFDRHSGISSTDSSVTVIGGSSNGIPMGIFQINEEGEIRGAINPSILAKTFIYEKKSFVFKDSKKNVIKFLNLCLQEIKTFYNKFYKLLEERTSLFEGIDTIKGQ